MITLVVFSKDRAMQLDSLLRSVKDHCTGIDRVVPIVYASNAVHENAYWMLANDESTLFTDLSVQIEDAGLGGLLADRIGGSDHVALAVDDMTFYAPSNFLSAAVQLEGADAFVWSWRLGSTYRLTTEGIFGWSYPALGSDPDYGYLWHSDGAIYRTADYMKMLDIWRPGWRTEQYTPNDLEAAVAARKPQWAASVGPHLGPLSPTCITWQINRVQTRYGSPAAEIPETNVDGLAELYLAGKRVDNEKLYAMLREKNLLRFNPPGARPTHVYASEEASLFWAGCVR